MDTLRRIAAGLMLICLALPQRSCEKAGVEQILYPLSEANEWHEMTLVVLLYALPLVVAFVPKTRRAMLVTGIVVCLFGLYHQSYQGWVWSLHVLIGWWVYTVSAVTYVVTSAILLWHAMRVRLDAARTPV